MNTDRFDAVVVGAGPAGSVAALSLARGGARVAVVDKSRFPRDKACGDLIGPRGVALLSDLKVHVEATAKVRCLRVVGVSGRDINMWCQRADDTHAQDAWVVKRTCLDNTLFNEAIRAGAVPIQGRVGNPIRDDSGRLTGLSLDDGRALGAEFFVGADGATTRLGQIANLVDPKRGIWCFAIRTYLPTSLHTPYIFIWDDKPWSAFPGYGWVFPDGTGCANVGVGIGLGHGRFEASRARRELEGFVQRMVDRGVLEPPTEKRAPARLGGWLRMGLAGTRVAARNVLLTGDAAALVNPYQGEGIAQALTSGHAAAQSILHSPDVAARAYASVIWNMFGRHEAPAATIQTTLLQHPRAASIVGRTLTSKRLSAALGESMAVYLGQLTNAAAPGRSLKLAKTMEWFSETMTSRSKLRRDIEASFGGLFSDDTRRVSEHLAERLAG
jgi:geranylgeranyl reductase family protein